MTDLIKKIKPLLLISFLPFLAVTLVAVFNENGMLAVKRQEDQLQTLHGNIESLNRQNQKLREEVDELKSDPFAVEKIARERLNLAKPGEKIYQMVPLQH